MQTMKILFLTIFTIICFGQMAFATETTASGQSENKAADKSRAVEEISPRKAKYSQWMRQRDAIKMVDLIGKTDISVVARGGKSIYNAHPTTVLLDDQKTLYCVWNIGHGGNASPLAKSSDGGKTWERIDSAMPRCYSLFKNCPSIYRIKDPQGKERIFVLVQRTMTPKGSSITEETENYSGYMPRVMSEDGGITWKALPPLGKPDLKSEFMCIMTFSSMIELKDGSTLGFFHRGNSKGEDRDLCIMKSITKDGGLTWSTPETILTPDDLGGKLQPCEPLLLRSPDGNELCCIMRENSRINGTSLVMFSRDEGKTWSKPIDTPWALSGDRHSGIYLPDGRLLIGFRDQVPNRGIPGGLYFGAWLGTYDDIKTGAPGQYRILLSKCAPMPPRSNGKLWFDGYYPSLHYLPDGTIIATTYECLDGDTACSIVSHRFKLSDIENNAK